MAEQNIKSAKNNYTEQTTVVLPNIKYTITDWSDYLIKAKSDFDEKMENKVRDTPQAKLSDFYFHTTIGKGGFGIVILVERKGTGEFYAAKLQKKETIVRKKSLSNIINEKTFLEILNSPFTLNMNFFFQDNVYIYFIMPLIEGGDVFTVLRRKGKFDEHLSRFYAAQVLLALEYLHYLNLLYRDLKPENLLLDREGYIKLADYGFVKQVTDRTYTFCGTPEYIAPEILHSRGYGKAVDFWSFGILLYELNCGRTPFYAENPRVIYDKATEGRYTIEAYFSTELRDIIQHLVVHDLTRRYGNLKRGVDDIKDHDWFKKIIWLAMVNKAIRPPFVPPIRDLTVPFEEEEIKLEKLSTDPYKYEFADF